MMRARAPRPSVVFILLDCGRADRFGAWGGTNPTSPVLDAFGRDGARFAWHFSNAHATRASMPQLMSGRYYASNILRSFQPQSNPHEYRFRAPVHAPALLPGILRDAGFQVVGTSAHVWVVPDSRFGAAFDRLDFLPPPEPRRAYVGAHAAVSHAIEQWRARPRDRPTFLYVHLMDLHLPRWVPASGCRFLSPGTAWRTRFDEGSRPLFGTALRRWDVSAAEDFSAEDRAIFAAIYDTLLASVDAEVDRLLAAVRADDPRLEGTLVVVTADHGEQLGEEGAFGHIPSLVDGVHRVPLLLVGGGVQPGQASAGISEHVDVVPTLLELLGVERDAHSMDGQPLLDRDGRLLSRDRDGAYYAWLRYQALRTSRHLLQVAPSGSPEANAVSGGERFWRMDASSRRRLGPREDRAERDELRRRIEGRLGERARAFSGGFGGAATEAFTVPAPFWTVEDGARVRLVPPTALRSWSILGLSGWVFARDSLASVGGLGPKPLRLSVEAPAGEYEAAVGVIPVGRRPIVGSRRRWKRGFLKPEPTEFIALGRVTSSDGRAAVVIPPAIASGRRLLQLRLVPHGVAVEQSVSLPSDEERLHTEQLRALGYVE